MNRLQVALLLHLLQKYRQGRCHIWHKIRIWRIALFIAQVPAIWQIVLEWVNDRAVGCWFFWNLGKIVHPIVRAGVVGDELGEPGHVFHP